jgi:two-component SAPR family response regulator
VEENPFLFPKEKAHEKEAANVIRENRNIDSKIQIPAQIPSYVERKRLHAEYREKKVTVFHAGAGFGKTMFMADVAHQQEKRCAWYQLEASDNEPILFLHILESSVKRVIPDFSFPLSSPIQEQTVEAAAGTFAETLSNLVSGPLLIAFDDFQEIQEETISQILSILIRKTSPEIHFFFATKGAFPSFLATFLAQGSAVLFGQAQLQFTQEEAALLLEKVTGGQMEPDALQRIYEYTEGWPVGLMFAGLGLQGQVHAADAHSVLRGSRIYDYIAYEVFRKLSFELQQFLMDTSVLDPLNPWVCDFVTGKTNAKNNLDYLVQENLFVIRLDGQKSWYRYHSIFKDFLNSQIKEERKREILRKASLYYMRKQDFEPGIKYALRCDDIETVGLGVELYAGELIQNGRTALLSQWIHFLEIEGGRMSWACLHEISAFYAYQGQAAKAADYLMQAAKTALQDEKYEIYSKYLLELLPALDRLETLSARTDFLMESMRKIKGKTTKYCGQLMKILLEYCVQMDDWDMLFSFRDNIRKGAIKVLHGQSEIIDCVEWLCRSQAAALYDENFLQEARGYQVYSQVFMDFGFYRYLTQEYRAGRLSERKAELAEVLSFAKGSLFAQWMYLYQLLLSCQRGEISDSCARKEARRLEEYRNRQEVSWPKLSEKDQKKLYALLAEPEERQEQSLPHLDVFCFGSFRVWTEDGKPLSWRTKKTRELFACLFAEQGKEMEKDVLMEYLWPEGDAQKSSALLDTTVSYLRKTLTNVGCGHAFVVQNKRYRLEMKAVRSDYARFLEVAGAFLSGDWDLAAEAGPETLPELYGSGYLSGEDYLWAVTERERLERRYLKAMQRLARHYFDQGQYRLAADSAGRALETDAFSNELAGLLIDSLEASGDRRNAKKQFEKYNSLWLEEMGQELTYDRSL